MDAAVVGPHTGIVRIELSRRELLARLGVGLFGVALPGALTGCGAPAASTGAAVSSGPTPPPPQAAPVVQPATATAPAPTVSVARIGTAGPPPSEVAAPQRGGSLRFGAIGDFLGGGGGAALEPQTISSGEDNLYSVWDRLVSIDGRQQLQPMLAESWETADDFRQITFHLRKGVQFHTGRELTADDVKWSLQRVQDPKLGSNFTGRIAPLTGIDTPDSSTVIVNASRPWVEAFDVFQQLNILDPVTFAAEGLSRPTGTGPFMFVEYVPGDHLRLTRNPNYWRTGIPYLDEVVVSIHRDAQAAVVSLEAGALDLISNGLPTSDFVRLTQDPGYETLLNDHTGTSWAMYLNCTRAPTNNKLVRQALNYALDRQRMADAVWHGLQAPIVLQWLPTSPAYDADKNHGFAFDLDNAKSLLAQAGVGPTHFDLIYQSPAPPQVAAMLQIYQADLAKIGIDVALQPLESAGFNAARNAFNFDLDLGGFTIAHLLPQSQMLGFGYGPDRNNSGFKDDTYSQLVNEILTESDSNKLHTLYGVLNDYYLDQSFVQHIVPVPERAAARKGIHGLRFDFQPALMLGEIWMA
jgi:peptide/nickel transport system substrate-binding protein